MNDSLKSIVAELLEIDAGHLLPERVLAGGRLQGSLGRSILDAAIRRRLSIQSPACYTAKTFGDLQAAVDGKPMANELPVAMAPMENGPVAESSVSTGIDIELVDSLPVTSDYWTHEFYTTHFTPAEIAYCLTQQNPRPHFAARWCAKEAAKKCLPQLLTEEMRNIEVVSRSNGEPSLRHHHRGRVRDLPAAVSLSHSDHSAVAVVVKVAEPKPAIPLVVSRDDSHQKYFDKVYIVIFFLMAAIALAVALISLLSRH